MNKIQVIALLYFIATLLLGVLYYFHVIDTTLAEILLIVDIISFFIVRHVVT
jgi:hypothetical protein